MNVLLIPNTQKDGIKSIVFKVISVLEKNNANIFIQPKDEAFFSDKAFDIADKSNYSSIDFAVVVGGDGTIIQAANMLLEYDVPILGVNFGTLGFLAAIEISEIDSIQKVFDNNYIIDERMTLKVDICHQDSVKSFTAINDVVVCKNAITGILGLDIECGNIQTYKYRGDGAIISTPSGSTAYAMSAGGPIMHPSVKAIAITPVCAHSLRARTIILPENEIICVKTNADSVHKRAFVVADGINSEELFENDKVYIKRYDKNIKFISLDSKQYYSAINSKLMEG